MGFRVLVVDDSRAMRSVVRRIIEISGFEMDECMEASHGQDALTVLGQHPVDIILTDINMPVMNGEQFLVSLKADKWLAPIPVVVVSTDGSDERVRRMIGMGADGYIKKPFFPEALRCELERILGVPNA